jgi:hypothetical protein
MISSNTFHIASPLSATGDKASGTLSAEAWFNGGERIGYDPHARAIVAGTTRPSGFSCVAKVILRTPSPSCLDFPMAHSAGRKFGRICRTLPRWRTSSSTMSAWATATSPGDYIYSTAERADLVEAI